MTSKIPTIFFGTSQFAKEMLGALLESSIVTIVGVVTQPDKPSGRKKTITQPEVKRFLFEIDADIPIYQPEKLRRAQKDVLKTNPELIIVADYGQMIPAKIINYPKYKCINVHGSLLPKLRGAVPIQRTILDGEKTAGVSIVIMTKDLDNGPILAQQEIALVGDETSGQLYTKASKIGSALLLETIQKWIAGNIEPVFQDEAEATYCYQDDISKENAQIQWIMTGTQIERKVRGFNPWPVAWSNISIRGKTKRLKIFKIKFITSENSHSTGELFDYKGDLAVQVSDGSVILQEIQVEGKKRLEGKEYLWLVVSQNE